MVHTVARPHISARRGAAAAAAMATVLSLLAGCSGFLSGSMAENIENVAAGNTAETGSMLVRNAFVLGPAPDTKIPEGGRAAVYLTLFNRASGPGGPPDRLVSASAGKAARSVRISGGAVTVPPKELVNVTLDQGALVLHNLTKPLTGGESIELTLRFERSGSVTFYVPVLPRNGAYATLSPFPTSSPAKSPTPATPGARP